MPLIELQGNTLSSEFRQALNQNFTYLETLIKDCNQNKIDKPTNFGSLSQNKIYGIQSNSNGSNTYIELDTNIFYIGITAPANTKLLWIDSSSSNIVKIYNGTDWVILTSAYAE